MRRGLIHWSRDEVPAAALERRLARLQREMSASGLAAVLVHTSTAQPAAVSWLTHFVPYSNDGLLVVFPEGLPAFFASFSKRVAGWIREVSHVGEIGLGANLGAGAAKLLAQRFGTARPRLGVVDRDCVPAGVLQPLVEAGWTALEDVSSSFARIRQPADAEEIALAARGASIARRALDAVGAAPRDAAEALAATERAARLEGAEEVFLRVAPDLERSAVMRRLEGEAAWGARGAVQVSLAYKGVWVRAARCMAHDAPPGWDEAQRWLAQAAPRLDAAGAPGKVRRWTVEACIGSQPLSAVQTLPPGALAVVSAELNLPGAGAWHGAVTAVIGDRAL
jgi:hypothetical protein